MINIAICDDNYNDLCTLSKHLNRFQMKCNIDFNVKLFHSGNDLIMNNQNHFFQIVLLDIELANENGIQVASILSQQAKQNLFIIFTSSYPEYMQESFEVHPFQFITKPIDYSSIEKVMNHILEKMNNTYVSKLVIDTYGETRFLLLKDIQYITAIKASRQILHFKLYNDAFDAKGTLTEYEKMLSCYGFISPTRGILVNISNIHSFKNKTVILEDGSVVPISRRKLSQLHETYANHIIKTLI